MGLFNRKPEINVEDVCKNFYDTQIFKSNSDLGKLFIKANIDLLTKTDGALSEIPYAKFADELISLRIEMFSLAWDSKFKFEELSVQQSIFTKRYLDENGYSHIWDIMLEYNTAIAKSTSINDKGEVRNTSQLASLDLERLRLAEKWIALNKDDVSYIHCIGRLANRLGAEIRKHDCAAIRLLTGTLADRLQFNESINPQIFSQIVIILFGFYDGAAGYLKNL